MAHTEQPTEFDTIFKSLEALSTPQVVDVVRVVVSSKEADAFAVLVGGLSTNAVRLLAARALVRLRRPNAVA
jgi:hypothetical protein